MAPRKRISRIAPRSVAAVEQVNENTNSHSVATQTDVPAAGSSKRKMGQNKLRPPPPQHLAINKMPAVNPHALVLALSEIIMGQSHGLPSFVPGPNEKSCQTVADGLADPGDRIIITNSAERQINYLKSLVSNCREEANLWDRNRLKMLLAQINGDPPPRWNSATQMWLEVDRLEQRIEAFDRGELLAAKKRKVDVSLDAGQEQGQNESRAEEQDGEQDERQAELPSDGQDERKTSGGT
ncbi:uncharacterized protein LOC6549839 [Drosophila erecta]|uniref:Uncharacterized protein n=1 Tax=Drosophila erecta TaxID=7220 RepID=B3NY78_DROER|nr:uncharacterized protein LOC6549839 [Drosophila erecta]EDV47663.1 uncharacterized protein Dere_GG19752 [Drosophila erecta]